MADRPIIFSAPMVRALLDGRKTMTRRIPTPTWLKVTVGDRLWVRENYYKTDDGDHEVAVYATEADEVARHISEVNQTASRHSLGTDWLKPHLKLRPSIHMPRWASRLTLEVTATKTECLDAISGTDAIAEGLASLGRDGENWHWDPQAKYGDGYFAPWRAFKALWESLHGPASWDARPVVALSFTVHKTNIDQMKEAA